MAAQIFINGLTQGAIYFLLAIGFSLIFGVARIANLAHTAFYMMSAYLAFTCMDLLGLNVPLSLTASIIVTTFMGLATYKFIIERVREHELTIVIITIALALVIQECILLIFGARYHGIKSYIGGNVEVLGVGVPNQRLLTLGIVSICIVGVSVFLFRSKVGLAIRGTAQDREIANLMGINVERMCLTAMAVAIALAAVAGAMVAPMLVVEPYMWKSPLVAVMAAVILGGLGSIKGSLIGAFILGYAETLVVFLLPMGSFIKVGVAVAVMLVVLMIKPEGLFGTVFEAERL